MKRLGLTLAAAAVLAAAPLTALAQRAASTAAPAAAPKPGGGLNPKQIEEARKRGMKEAPALVAASAIKTCQVTDAIYKGQGDDKDVSGKTVGKLSAYEVACQSGPGYLVLSKPSSPQPQLINCIIAGGGASPCQLPQNSDFKAALTPAVQQAGRQCAVSDVRYVGTNVQAGQDFYEVACAAPQLGFLLGVSTSGQPPIVNDCLAALGTSNECKLTTKAMIAQSYAPLVQQSGKACQVSDVRSIGRSKTSGEDYTEVACSGGTPGFVLVTDSGGKFKNAVDCAKAGGIGDGCKLTDVTVAKTEEAGTYSKLAAKAGYPCDVKEYRFIGMDAENREVVELACKNRPDGAVALFSEKGSSRIVDCVRAGAIGGSTCKLSDPSVVYSKYSDALASKGRNSCKVSGAQFLARTTDGTEYVETACADGAPGWVIAFTDASVKELLTCRQAGNSGLACKLPTNKAG